VTLVISLDTARDRIEPIEGLLIEAHKTAAANWRTLLTEQPALALPLDKTTRANFLHCHITSEIGRGIERLGDVKANDKLDFYALMIGQDILLRFKYIGHDGTPRNVPTERQKLLARQQYDEAMVLALTGDTSIAPPTLLTCGYTLTDEHEVDRIEILRECVGHPTWSYDIFGGTRLIEPLVMHGMSDDARPAKVSSSRNAQRKDEGEADAV
jgi:hypothetical protein